MKKKITAIFLCVALVAIAVVGASLAYFTDTDSKNNTFTVGKVDITLVEKNADGTEFTQGQKLYPGTKTQNNIAKILMICRQCVISCTEPAINYQLLSDGNIYLFGQKLDFMR